MDSIWFKIYVGVGVVILVWFIVDMLWRQRDSLLSTAVAANEWMLVLAVVAWPIFLPLLGWSRRRRKTVKAKSAPAMKTRSINHDEEM